MIEYIVDNNAHIENNYNSNKIKITTIILLIPFLVFIYHNMGIKSTSINLFLSFALIATGEFIYSYIVKDSLFDLFNVVISSIIISIIMPKDVSVILLVASIAVGLVINKLLKHKLKFNYLNSPILYTSILLLLMMILGKNIIYSDSTLYMSLICLAVIFVQFVMQNIKLPILIVYVATFLLISYIHVANNGLEISSLIDKSLQANILFFALIASLFKCPVTPVGQILCGLFLGIITCILTCFINPCCACIFSILLMNIFTYCLDIVGAVSRFEFNKSIFLFVTAWLLIIVTGLLIK